MARIEILTDGGRKGRSKVYEFTITLLPVYNVDESEGRVSQKGNTKRLRLSNPIDILGYQVTVPSLPGVITFGRTEAEAEEMARDAIRCHIEGLKKDGEEVPVESAACFRKLRISA
jgi:antitoxin HicB